MKRGTKIALGIGAGLSLALAAAVAGAHPNGGGPGWGMGGGMGMGMGMGVGMGMGPGMMGGGPGMMRGGPGFAGAYGVEERLAAQKAALKITAAQESAWQAYANVSKTQFDAMQAQHKAMYDAAPGSSAERSDLHAKFLKERSAQAEALNTAYKSLYTVLTPEQRATLEERAGFGPGWRSGRLR